MGRQITGDRNENMPPLVSIAPRRKLPDAGFEHLIGMEARIFAQHRKDKRGDQRFWRMAKRKMPRHQPCCEINLSLPVECVEQGGADRLLIGRKVVELIVVLARDAGRRDIQITRKVERHGAVHDGPHGRNVTVDARGPDPLEHLVERIGMGEDMVRRLPVRVLVGIAEASHAQRRCISEGLSQVGRSGARADRRLQRIDDPRRIVSKQLPRERRVI